MARVVTHAMKQASLNLRDMVDKKSIGLELADIEEFAGVHKVWEKDETKPEIIETTIEQIRALFNVGNEVKDWKVSYFPPAGVHNNRYTEAGLVVKPTMKGLGGRFVVVVGTREVANMSVTMGRVDAETPLMMLSGDCLYVKITLCPVLEINFNNMNGERMAARKGFRDTIVRKNPENRHVLVFDALVEMDAIVDKVKKDFGGSLLNPEKEKKTDDAIDAVANLASGKTE